MGSSLVTAPTIEPMSLAEAKSHLRVDQADDDALIATLIVAAREWIEGQTHRALMQQTWDFTYDRGWPLEGYKICLRLPLAPAASVTSVKYIDENGVEQTLSAALYKTVLSGDHPRIERAYQAEWPSPRDQAETVTVRAVCGYGDQMGDVPQPLRLAIRLLVGHWYEHREAVAIGVPAEVPLAVEALISPYRRSCT